jgi:hypothetical protein
MKIFGEIGILADDGERVQCHICGKWFAALAQHVRQKHGWSREEYCDHFGLKRTTKLSGAVYLMWLKKNGAKHLEQYLNDPAHRDKLMQSITGDNSPSKRPDVRRCISIQSKNSEHRAKIATAVKKPEVREKISKALTGKPSCLSDAGRRKKSKLMSERNKKQHPSTFPGAKEKMLAALNSETAQIKRAATMRSPEYRAACAQRQKDAWAKRKKE